MRNFLTILFICIFLSLGILPLMSQDLDKLERTGERQFLSEDFDEALVTYQDILKIEPKHKLGLYRAEICSLLTNYASKPLDDFQKYAKSGGRGDKFYYYWLGRINLEKHNFEEAIDYLNQFLEIKKYKSPIIIAESKQFIQTSKNAIKFYEQASTYEIQHLGDSVNSDGDELSPAIADDNNVVFLSSKTSEESQRTRQTFRAFGSKDASNIKTSPSLQEAFSEFEIDENGRDSISDEEWKEVVLFEKQLGRLKIEGRYILTDNGRRLIFSSSKFSKGIDLDLYESVKGQNGKWGRPQEVSKAINTPENEYSPFISPDGQKLYFSSTGHNSIGGYDVFYSEKSPKTGRWLPPVQLPYPINTTDHDIHFVTDACGNGYLASDRFGSKGGFDLYYFGSGEPCMTEEDSIIMANEKLTDTAEPMAENDVEQQNVTTSTETAALEKKDIAAAKSTKQTKQTSAKGERTMVSKGNVRPETPTNNDLSTRKVDGLNNVYFPFKSYKLNSYSKKALEQVVKLLGRYPEATVVLKGHSDNAGTEERNIRMSRLRGEAVLYHLKSLGLNNKVIVKAYGSSRPLASNDDEIEGREFNRRVEIQLLR